MTLSKFIFRQQEPELSVRSLLIDGNPWFVAADVCAALDIDNASLAVNGRPDRDGSGLPAKDRGIASVNTPSGEHSCPARPNPREQLRAPKQSR